MKSISTEFERNHFQENRTVEVKGCGWLKQITWSTLPDDRTHSDAAFEILLVEDKCLFYQEVVA